MTDSESASKPETSGQSRLNDDVNCTLPTDKTPAPEGMEHPKGDPERSRPSLNRAQRRAVDRGMKRNSPLEEAAKDLAPHAKKAAGGLADLFKGKAQQYTPVTKSLDAIGLEPTMGMVDLGNGPEQCIVIPVQQLVFKEWQHMTGSNYEPMPISEINSAPEETGMG